MTEGCPNYRGNSQCKFHFVYYELTSETIQKYCTTQDFPLCPENRARAKPSGLVQTAQSLPNYAEPQLPSDADCQIEMRKFGRS